MVDIIPSPAPELVIQPGATPTIHPAIAPDLAVSLNLPPSLTLTNQTPTPPPGTLTPPISPQLQALPPANVQLQIGSGTADVESDSFELVNEELSELPAGSPCYLSGALRVRRAAADNFQTCQVIALALERIAPDTSGRFITDGVLTLTAAEWESIVGSFGLEPRGIYFLSTEPGKLTREIPTSGNFLTRIGQAINSLSLEVSINSPIGL